VESGCGFLLHRDFIHFLKLCQCFEPGFLVELPGSAFGLFLSSQGLIVVKFEQFGR
jgi:hypothetical protein